MASYVVTTLAGSSSSAFVDGAGTGTSFYFPRSVSLEGAVSAPESAVHC